MCGGVHGNRMPHMLKPVQQDRFVLSFFSSVLIFTIFQYRAPISILFITLFLLRVSYILNLKKKTDCIIHHNLVILMLFWPFKMFSHDMYLLNASLITLSISSHISKFLENFFHENPRTANVKNWTCFSPAACNSR